ncbi:hypothetical protein JCM10207_006628 [Rhodosporidiobolus poonsookiae]
MYRPAHSRKDSNAARQLSSPHSYSRRCTLFTPRARIHPVALVPVFLLGALLAPIIHLGQLHPQPHLPDPVYRPQDYDYRPSDVFAEPDAPPLARDRDDDRINKDKDRVLARGGHGDGADEWEWWDPDADAASSPALSGAALTSSLYTVHSGHLYFPSSPLTIPSIPASFPAPPANRDAAQLPRPRMPDEGLTLPPPAPASWLAPGELFARPPGKRKRALDAQALKALNAPLPPAPARRNPALAAAAAAGRGAPAAQARGGGANQRWGKRVEKDAAGHVLGPNAAAMARAKREGLPFKPGKPYDLVLEDEERERERKRDEARKKAEGLKGVKWAKAEPGDVKVPQAGKAWVVAGAGAEEDDEEDDEDEFDDEEDEDGEAQDYEIDPDDDAALLAAIRELSPAEFAQLSPAERALVADLEAKEAAAAGAEGGNKRRKRPSWTDNDGVVVRKEAPRAAPKKPVYKGPVQGIKGNQRADGAGGGKKLRKRALVEVEEPVAQVEETAEAVEEGAAPPVDEPAIPSPSSDEPADAPFPAPAPLQRRALAADLSSPSDPSSDKPAPADRLHPIAHLIARAEEEWDDLLRRQSQTLEQAVGEYVRRYGRRPPAGFDAWWRYAMENRVILVDEYDQIHSDLEPFFSLPPAELRRRAQALQDDPSLPWHAHSFGISVEDGRVGMMHGRAEGSNMGGQRTEDLLDMMGEFAGALPDLQVRLAEGDEPAVVVSGEAKARHLEYAREGKLLGLSQSYEILEPSGFTAWDALCMPNSTARRAAQGLATAAPSGPNLRSFVSIEHALAMDVCEHPELRGLNGITAAWSGPRPHLLYPLFSFSKTTAHSDILLPALSNDYYVEVGRDPTWEQKKHNKFLWRGDTTGAYFARGTGWRQSQRARLVALANAKEGSTTLHIASRSSDDALRRTTVPTSSLTAHYFDVAFATGPPVQCSKKDQTCTLLQHELRFDRASTVRTPDQENQYKYVVDVDANYPSGKFKRHMSSRSLVLKSTIFPEWWTKRIMPWYHYVPLRSDYSDLTDIAAFFIGLPDGTGAHDQVAKRLAQQGKKWADEHFREADMAAYMFRLYLEYARLLNRDEKNLHSMDYNP